MMALSSIDTLIVSMKKSKLGQYGFSLIELLITIAVVAILASVTVGAYSGVQQRSRDTQRVSDMNVIIKALEMHKTLTGNYPTASTINTISGWEVSSKNPSQFLSALKTAGIIRTVPTDPINDSLTNTKGFLYRYFRYNAGENGCDAGRGAYYVLVAGDAESSSSQLPSSPGFQCSTRSWSNEGGWVTGGYTK